MKKTFLSFVFAIFSIVCFSQEPVHVDGYYKSNGTYVEPHYRTSPNSTKSDNYSTYPNYNPYTGQQGKR